MGRSDNELSSSPHGPRNGFQKHQAVEKRTRSNRTHIFRAIVVAFWSDSAGGQTATNDVYVASFLTGHLTRLDGSTGAPVFDVPLSGSLTYVVRQGYALYVSTTPAPASSGSTPRRVRRWGFSRPAAGY